MNIEISSVAEKQNLEKERIILRVTADTDVGSFALLQTGFSGDEVTIGVHQTYWFPYKRVEAGDLVVLYTKKGTQNENTLKSGKKAHFFYWGLSAAIWGKSDRAPVLLYAPEWESKRPDEL